MIVQTLEEYKNRTEYRILSNFTECRSISINSVQPGILVLPGVTLQKMDINGLKKISDWVEADTQNQLILTPSWNEINLKDVFRTTVELNILRTTSKYIEAEIDYEISTTAKDVIFQDCGKCFGIHYRKNTGTGVITVITVPLLDYKYIQFEEKFQNLFWSLTTRKEEQTKNDEPKEGFILDDAHIYMLILAGAELSLNDSIANEIRNYFGVSLDEEVLKEKYSELKTNSYLSEKGLTPIGLEVIREKKLKAFISAVQQRRKKDDGWN